MTAATLLTDLKAKGVVVSGADGSLRLRAPCGVLTSADRAAVAAHKPDLLALLAPNQEPEGSPTEPDGKMTGATVADAIEAFPGSRVVADKQPAVWPPEGGYVPEEAQRRQDERFGPTSPAGPCPACDEREYHWAGDGWTCSTCHPRPTASRDATTMYPGPHNCAQSSWPASGHGGRGGGLFASKR